jgi:rhamnose utilization protein RhaD (predicted bifunctional aldolase and dehydrogenase)/NAD(P)-dependent dehydrogenase (short-subunit alcohol dehydrogenase family)
MKNRWSESEISKIEHDPLLLRVYSSRLLGLEPDLVLHGGGNTSVKTTQTNLYGEREAVIYVKGSGWDLATIEAQGFAPVRLTELQRMAGLEQLSDSEMVRMQRAAMTNPYAPNPSVEAILHAIIPFDFVDHTHADAVVTITNTPNGLQLIKDLYGDQVLIVPYIMPGFLLAKEIYYRIQGYDFSNCQAMILLNHGVFTFDNSARRSYEKMLDVVTKAEQFINEKVQLNSPESLATQTITNNELQYLAKLRKDVAQIRGKPVYAMLNRSAQAKAFAALKDVHAIATRGPLTPDHIIRTKQAPVVLSEESAQALDEYVCAYKAYFVEHTNGQLTCLDPAPRWAVWKDKGLVAFGTTVKDSTIIEDINNHTIRSIQIAQALGGWQALPEKALFEMEYWELEQAKLNKAGLVPEFVGKVALITGAASGIGRACVEVLVERGAAVVALDINPALQGMYNRAQVLELVCDLTQSADLSSLVEEAIQRFGGLDIVISNAGIFTANETIEQMSPEAWCQSIDVNLTSHQRLLRACIPFLKHGIDPSVVFVASKNVPAPGPGAGAYSVAKAGLTQLARVAALELGRYRIRVNTVHPNAVFDTAVWSDQVLAQRAAHYGLSVDEYKRNNLMRTKVNSQDVAAMVCTMAGPAFAKTTGAQVPVDGGNERVI